MCSVFLICHLTCWPCVLGPGFCPVGPVCCGEADIPEDGLEVGLGQPGVRTGVAVLWQVVFVAQLPLQSYEVDVGVMFPSLPVMPEKDMGTLGQPDSS